MNGLNKRLATLEQAARPAEDIHFGTVLVDMLSYGIEPLAVALLVQGRRAEAAELVEVASNERGLGLTDVQIDAALRHIEKHLASHRVRCAESVRHPHWVKSYESRHKQWRADAAHLARNNSTDDEEERYAELVEFWRQRDGATQEEIMQRYIDRHDEGLRAIAQRLTWLRLDRGQAADEAAVYADLVALEQSLGAEYA